MGESSGSFMRSLSQPSGTSCEVKEGDLLRSLTTSISFGRFVSESLAWEKWSSFNHNRYLEEVEKYSRPGSVAQKKAYFEAHYRRIAAKKAAALLEQQNVSANDSPEPNMMDKVHDGETRRKEAPNTELVFTVDESECDLTIEGKETSQVEVAETIKEPPVIAENPIQVRLSDQLKNVENHRKNTSTHQKRRPIKDLASSSQKKPAISSTKPSTYSGLSKLRAPVKLVTPVQPRKEDNATLNTKNSARESTYKKISTPKSLHMSINFSSHAGKTSKTSSPLLNKIGNSRISRPFAKTFKDSSTPGTPTRASVNGVSEHTSKTRQREIRRTTTLLDRSVSGIRTADRKSQSLYMDCSKSSSSSRSKARSPMLCSSFTFRSEERAAKRKEKLEENINTSEEEKVKLQPKSKEKAENDIKNMGKGIGFRAKANANIHRETESPSSNHMKKIPPTRPRSPKLGRKPAPSMVQDTSSRPGGWPSVKTDGSKHVVERNNRRLNQSLTSLPKKNMHENSSPNIQL